MAIDYATIFLKFFGVNTAPGDNGGANTADVLVDARWASGITANKGDKLFHDERSLNASSNEDLDFQALTDSNGVALALADITCIIFSAASTNGAEMQMKPAAANPWITLISGTAPILHLPAGATYVFYVPTDPGLTVGAGALGWNVANQDAGAAGSYTITILGRSA